MTDAAGDDATPSQEPVSTPEWDFAYWAKCEDVAIHFNQLIIKMRTQSLGGLAAIAAIMGWGARGEAGHGEWITGALIGLLVVWSSIAAIDALYYSRLLKGAVDEIKRVEELTNGRYVLSIAIDRACGVGERHDRTRWGRGLFYGLPAAGLIAAIFYAVFS